MSRIRSIHPGIWTDDAFMALSANARLLIIGIWTEAFDDGVFDWKPLTLKARIFPADGVDVPALLDELMAGDFVRREEVDGRKVGLVRNFRDYQRPKKPNSSGLLRPEWGTYVGIANHDPEPVPHQFSTGGEKSPQMEDGGGRKKKKDTPSGERSAPEIAPPEVEQPSLEVQVYALGKQVLGKSSGGIITRLRRHCRGDLAEVSRLLRQATEKATPVEWVSAVLRGDTNAEAERRENEIYAGLQ